MKKHRKKMVAPIIITIVMIVYFVCYFGFLMSLMGDILQKLLLGICPALLGIGLIYVCVERIREIKGGEEDDLSQY